MGGDVQKTDFQTNVLNGINQTADEAYQSMLEKKAEYEAAMNRLSIFQQKKYYLECELKKPGTTNQFRNEYNNMINLFNDAEINTDILRSSLQSRIFYSGKMNNSAAIASAFLA